LRRFELILMFAAMFAVAWPVIFGVRPRRGIVALALSAALILQLQVEGYRWQLIPLYLVVIGLAVGDVIFIDRELRWTNRVARGVFGLLGVALASILAFALPVPTLPLPSGGLPIGTFSVELVDTQREEIYGPTPGGPRRFMAQVWYPSVAVEGATPAPWTADWDVVAPAAARRMGFPSWFLDHTRYTTSHTNQQTPVAPGTYPVIIYSHGWGGFRSVAVNQLEALASKGYIVIAPDHTYGSVATRFEDGVIAELDSSALPTVEEVGEEDHAEAAATLIATYAADLTSIMDELEDGQLGAFASLAASVDLERLGVYGHSAGGGAALSVCLDDERCAAVLGLDPWVEHLPDRVLRQTPTRPTLLMRSDEWRDSRNEAVLRGLAGRAEAVTYWVDVEGSGHYDFVALPLFSPVASQLGLKGPIPAGRVIPIVENYLVGFFDVFLLGTGPANLENVTFDEVSVEVVNP
jgi:dienelactone hydrolase